MAGTLIQLGQVNGEVTTFGIPYEPGHDDIAVLHDADTSALNAHSQRQQKWMHSLSEDVKPYWTHLNEVDHAWPAHSDHPPVWVSCPGHPTLEQALAEHFSVRGHSVDVGRPGEDRAAPATQPAPPAEDEPPAEPAAGSGPSAQPGGPGPAATGLGIGGWMMLMTLGLLLAVRAVLAGFTNDGKDLIARAIGDAVTAHAGTTTSAPGATTVTDTGGAFPASSAGANGVHQGGLVGHVVSMATAYMVVVSNTSTVLTGDMWHTFGAPDTVAGTPSTGAYYVAPGQAPAIFTGISVASRAFNGADQFLSNDGTTISELWFSGGGLKRKVATWAHTTSTNTFTLTTTWTANGSDTLPQAVAKWGAFVAEVTAAPSAATSGPMLFNTNLASTATLAAVGDNVTTTDTGTET